MKQIYIILLMTMVVVGVVRAEQVLIDKDAYVRGGMYTNVNWGVTNISLFARQAEAANTCKIYVEVDVASMLDADEVFANAALKFTAHKTSANTGNGHYLRLYGIVDNNDLWTEDGIVWTNAPKNDVPLISTNGTVQLAQVQVFEGTFTSNSVWTFSSPEIDQYLNWIAGAIPDPYGHGTSSDTKATFIVTSVLTDYEDFFIFESSEKPGALGPVLEVETVEVVFNDTYQAPNNSAINDNLATRQSAGSMADSCDSPCA